VPGWLQALIWRRRCRRCRKGVRGIRRQADAGGQSTGHSLQLHKLDQESNRNDRDRLLHDGGEHRQNRCCCAEAQQGEYQAQEHGDDSDDEADEGELPRVGRAVPKHAEANQDRKDN
jgi:hypothetical protein